MQINGGSEFYWTRGANSQGNKKQIYMINEEKTGKIFMIHIIKIPFAGTDTFLFF